MRTPIDKLALLKTILWTLTFGLWALFWPQGLIENDRKWTRR